MKNKIWLSSPHMGGNEMKYVQEAYYTNWIAPLGPNVNEFENDLAKYTKIENVAALSAGTAAIHLALIMLGVERDDEVICSSFTFSATTNPILYQGAKPIFVDSEDSSWNMDPVLLKEAIEDRISKGKKPKAILVVHLYGMPANMGDIMKVANDYNIPVVEDAAEALGSTYKGKALGTFGIMGVLSFNGNKIITTSGGGALISNDKNLIERSRFLATQARDNAPHYQHSNVGYNYRMSNIVAGIGRGQMEVIDKRVSQRRENHDYYLSILKDVNGVSVFTEPNNDYFSNHWLSCILVDSTKTKNGISREDIRLAMLEENIETRPLWKPMHMQPIFEKYPKYINGTSEKLFDIGLCLPSGSNMTSEEKNRVKEILYKLLK